MSSQPDTPWKRAAAHKRALRSERQGAAQEGGRAQPNSGSLPGRKGDFHANGFLVDDKVTDKRSWRVLLDGANGWVAICRHAMSQGRLPSMRLTIAEHKLRIVREEDWLWLVSQVDMPGQSTNFS